MKKAPLQVLFLLFCQQNIMVDRPIKTCLKGFPFYSGAKKPHGLCHCRLQRHVKRLHHRKTFLDGFAHLINLHITAFMRHLSRHNDLLSLSAPVVHRLLKTLFSIGRQSAYTKGFNNDCIIIFRHPVQNPPVHAGNQFQEKYLRIHPMIKPHPFPYPVPVINIKDDPVILNHCNIRIIDTGKRIVTFGTLLLRPGTCDHFSAKDDIDAMRKASIVSFLY